MDDMGRREIDGSNGKGYIDIPSGSICKYKQVHYQTTSGEISGQVRRVNKHTSAAKCFDYSCMLVYTDKSPGKTKTRSKRRSTTLKKKKKKKKNVKRTSAKAI